MNTRLVARKAPLALVLLIAIGMSGVAYADDPTDLDNPEVINDGSGDTVDVTDSGNDGIDGVADIQNGDMMDEPLVIDDTVAHDVDGVDYPLGGPPGLYNAIVDKQLKTASNPDKPGWQNALNRLRRNLERKLAKLGIGGEEAPDGMEGETPIDADIVTDETGGDADDLDDGRDTTESTTDSMASESDLDDGRDSTETTTDSMASESDLDDGRDTTESMTDAAASESAATAAARSNSARKSSDVRLEKSRGLKGKKVAKVENTARIDKVERAQRLERPAKPNKPTRAERPSKPEKIARVQRPDRPTRPNKPEKPLRPQKPEKPNRPGKS